MGYILGFGGIFPRNLDLKRNIWEKSRDTWEENKVNIKKWVEDNNLLSQIFVLFESFNFCDLGAKFGTLQQFQLGVSVWCEERKKKEEDNGHYARHLYDSSG